MKKSHNFINADDQHLVPGSGPYITSKFESNTAELYYVEQLVPADGLAKCIYWSCCNFHFNDRKGCASIQHDNTYNNICSIWDTHDLPPDESPEAVLEYSAPGTHDSHFQGEGTGLHTDNAVDSPMPWKVDTWYATVIRRWYKPGENVTHMAYFMYDYSSGIWTEYMAATIPGADIALTGDNITGALERYAGSALGYSGIYGQHFKMHSDGSWEKPLYYTVSGGEPYSSWTAETVYQNTNIKVTAGGNFGNSSAEIKLTPNQFDNKPKPIGPCQITDFYVSYNKDLKWITASWSINNKYPPQLSYSIKIFKNSTATEPVWTNNDSVPDRRKCTFYTQDSITGGIYIVSIKVMSIFNEYTEMQTDLIVL